MVWPHPLTARIVEEVYQSTRHCGGYRDEYKVPVAADPREVQSETSRPSSSAPSTGATSRSSALVPTPSLSTSNGTIRCPCGANRDYGKLMIQCEVSPEQPPTACLLILTLKI